MPHSAALPFLLKRASEVFSGSGMTTTRETVHGLLRLHDDQLTIQWRVGRKTEHLGTEMRTDQEVEPVRTIVVPLRLRRSDRLAAEEFGAELALAIVDHRLAPRPERPRLGDPNSGGALD